MQQQQQLHPGSECKACLFKNAGAELSLHLQELFLYV
jgi:hypothetical protein